MKFEEVLPKMRDEGRIGKVGGNFFKFENGLLLGKSDECSPWTRFPIPVEDYLRSDGWSLSPSKVKKWKWVFGYGKDEQLVKEYSMTEAEAEKYKNEYHFEWAERIMRTVTEEEA